MSIAEIIENKVKTALLPSHFELINESHMHAGPATESHFNMIAVAPDFDQLSMVKRHQLVYKVLREELSGPVHALALHLYNEAEWAVRKNKAPDSPDCAGINK